MSLLFKVNTFRTLGLMLLAFLVSLALFTTKGKTVLRPSEHPPELVLQLGHSLGVACTAFAPDGTWVASGAADNSIVIWQLPSGRHLRTLAGHNGPIRSVAISANGEWLASGSNDRAIKVWNVATGTETFTLTGHTGSINSLAFSPDGEWLVSGSSDKSIRIWNPATGKQLQSLDNQPDEVNVLTFSKSGDFLASSAGKEIRLWDVKKWKDPRILRRHNATVTAVAFSNDGNSIASGSADGTVLVWRRGSDREQFALRSNSSSVNALSFGLEGSLISLHSDGGLESWDPSNGQKRSAFAGDRDAQAIVFASFSSDAAMLAFGLGERSLRLRSTATGKVVSSLENHVTGINAVAFSSDGRWFAAAANDSAIRIWQVATGRELPRLSCDMGYLNTIAFSPDNQLLAAGSNSGMIKVWDLSTAQVAYSLPRQGGGVNIVAFSPDGKTLAAGGIDNKVEIWELESKRVRFLTGHSEEITTLAFIESGKKLISAGSDKTIRLWNVNSGEAISSFDNQAAEVNAISVSPDGQLLAAANVDTTVRLWKISDPAPIKTFTGHAGQVWTVAFNPSSTVLASGSDDHNVILWDLQSGKAGSHLKGNSDSISGLSFTRDGRFIACANDDGSITIWDSASAALKVTLVSMPNSDDWLVATPDGLFDGSPESWNLMLWRFDDSTFNVLPVESFFNEYYYPGVLAEIFAGKDPKAPSDIVQRDRRQPRVDLKVPNQDAITRNIDIEIEVTGVPPDGNHSTEGGAKDLRLFRNGLLVKKWAGELLQTGNTRTLRTTIQVVAGENRISAYAFNHDNIKSLDATSIVTGPDTLKRQGAAHILVIGIEQYENPRYNLKYSVSDATEMGAQLKAQQERLRRYNPIVTIPLTNAEATKKNILLALARLAGSNTGPLPADAPKIISTLNPAQPEDAVVIYFSGHGMALRNRFYLVPHDLGYKGNQLVHDVAGLTTIINHSISDEELVNALQSLEADQLLVVIDACYSGQALESNEKRRGPMNTKGLAQLAYEKGMYVLTASQSMEVAFEADALKHSYLAFALLEEGLKKRAADENKDGNIFLKEWFDYADQRVPEIRRSRQRGRKELVEVEADEQNVQRPRVFYTREMGAKQFLIAQ